jgi:two-component system OmpR family sensor kinase
MMRSLNVKLLGAFALVILLGAAITFVVARQDIASQFMLYVSQREQLRAQTWAPLFADYYARTGSWTGVESVLSSLPSVASPGAVGAGRGGPRHGQNGSTGAAGTPGPHGMGPGPEDRVILADSAGQVVLDSQAEIVGQALPANQLEQGVPLTVNGQRVGTLLVVAPQSSPSTTLTDNFLTALNRGILLAAVLAGLVALLLGAVLVRQIIAPLRRLQSAAGAIAAGDLSQRIQVNSRDEVGDVAHSFNQMAEALERNERLRRHMIADIAHELRTPLTVIRGQLEALLDGVFPLTQEQLAPIYDEALLLSRLVADLRELALAEAGQLKIEPQPVDMGTLAGRIVAAVEPAAADKGVALTLHVSPPPPTVSADADRLSQVMHNLLSNALRHTPAGGRIEVSVKTASVEDLKGERSSAWQQETAAKPGSRSADHAVQSPAFRPSHAPVLVTVRDTGPGIPAEDLPYIFDRFYRADKSRSRSVGGSGLGLTIARYIVEAHGGRIWAESQVGQGTRVQFIIP